MLSSPSMVAAREGMEDQEWAPGRKERRSRSRNGELDRLEIEIHEEKVRVWVDGASAFLQDPENLKMLVAIIEKTLDRWFKARAKTALAAFGLTALVSMLLAGLGWFGWKGWTGGK